MRVKLLSAAIFVIVLYMAYLLLEWIRFPWASELGAFIIAASAATAYQWRYTPQEPDPLAGSPPRVRYRFWQIRGITWIGGGVLLYYFSPVFPVWLVGILLLAAGVVSLTLGTIKLFWANPE